jgi:hypothetical protein
MDTVSTKLIINDGFCDFELWGQIGKLDGRWVWIDLRMSLRPESIGKDATVVVANLKRQLADANKNLIEIVCVHASELLQSGERTLLEVTSKWIGTRFEPSGYCDAVKNAICNGKVTSPLDAFAKLIQLKIDYFDREATNG